jgi:GntR family transcriptional regulator/MocR family aminotransferase
VAATLSASADGELEIVVPTQGLHMIAYLPENCRPDMAAEIRSMADVETRLISETRITPHGRDGFILGFSGHPLNELTDAANRLGRAAVRHRAMKAET